MKRVLTITIAGLLWHTLSLAQEVRKCGYDLVKAPLLKLNPNFEQELKKSHLNVAKGTNTTTSATTIPVVFHIVLDSSQIAQIGDTSGIADRVNTQLQVLNADYNKENADSSIIPTPFKALYGNVRIKFALAHTDPIGNASRGWSVTKITANGFDYNANPNDPAGAAKHDSTGGADAWDVTRYLNIWVINFLQGPLPSGILGLTIPPAFTVAPNDQYPANEMGVLLNYGAFGKRTSATEYFYQHKYDKGRTLTHEVGHYFGLFHTWGDDDGKCPGDVGGSDDGISDTPPEANANYSCRSFPYYDVCSSTGNGVMYMNYMDYTDDSCMNMFTLEQVNVMDSKLNPSGESYNLSRHPELLQYPGTQLPTSDNYVIGPNPSTGIFYIMFEDVPTDLQSVAVTNILGWKVYEENEVGQQNTTFPVDITGMPKGLYFLQIRFSNHTELRKIVLR
ncbi:MAG: zinc-dependent metalloprotease [Bacteroidota bacterium]